jgi:hypothetical protein
VYNKIYPVRLVPYKEMYFQFEFSIVRNDVSSNKRLTKNVNILMCKESTESSNIFCTKI